MLKIKKDTDLNHLFAELNNEISTNIEVKSHSLPIANVNFQTPMRKKIFNHKTLTNILNTVSKIDFKLLYEKLDHIEGDKVEKANIITDLEKITIILEYLLHIADELDSSFIMENEISYLFNGKYHEVVETKLLRTFLGEVAHKTGISLFKARSKRFIDDLYSQYSQTAAITFSAHDYNLKINLANGTLHLEGDNYEIKSHNKEDFFKYVLSFDFDPDAQAPIFEKFIDTVLPEKNSQNVLMEYFGYILTKNFTLEKILIILGTGSNGKSVLFDVINALLGPENVSTISMNHLCDTNGYYRATLGTKLLNYTNEFGGKIDLQMLKKLVSGEPLDARLPFGNPITVRDYSKFIINSNNLPNVEHTHAFFRRQLIIPFKVTIKDSEKDIHLAKKIIKNELPGVLNLVLKGLKRLILQNGFSESQEIKDEIEKYQLESNTVSQFLDEEGWEKSTSNKIRATEFYSEYVKYCKENNLKICTGPNFRKRLRDLNFEFKLKDTNNYTTVYCQKKDNPTQMKVINTDDISDDIIDLFKNLKK